jgi:hypothetical protein
MLFSGGVCEMVDLNDLDMGEIRDHYVMRERIHRRLRGLLEIGNTREFVRLALGMTDGAGNYSASEHGMGPRILAVRGAEEEVFDLGIAVDENEVVNRLPTIIYERSIANLKISVGSEMAMMLKPDVHWVGNKRTIWTHLLVRHNMDETRANEALRLYFTRDDDSEMDYEIWRDLYLAVGPDLLTLGQRAVVVAETQQVEAGRHRYLWPDAVATFLFDRHAGR